jgi:serine protease SohB
MKRWIPFVPSDPVVAVIRLHGTIATGARGQLNDIVLAPQIERAFRRGKPKAVALSINSPGGSPVQSSLIAARIRRLAAEKELPVFAFVEDAAASGGYWLACAGDKIFADRSSIVGSIGVIMASFGLDQFIARFGVERRVYASGDSKSQLDPFRPENPEDVARIKAIGGDIHKSFIEHVKTARGDRLADDARLFTGEYWTADAALGLGLIDGIGHLVPTMKELYGDKVRFAVYGPKKSLFQRFGARLALDAIDAIEERAHWARFGL